MRRFSPRIHCTGIPTANCSILLQSKWWNPTMLPSSSTNEVIEPQLHSIMINGWGADYGDPQNYLGQETYGNDNAYYSSKYSCINNVTEETEANKELLATYKEYTSLVEAADAITDDMDARYQAYA